MNVRRRHCLTVHKSVIMKNQVPAAIGVRQEKRITRFNTRFPAFGGLPERQSGLRNQAPVIHHKKLTKLLVNIGGISPCFDKSSRCQTMNLKVTSFDQLFLHIQRG